MLIANVGGSRTNPPEKTIKNEQTEVFASLYENLQRDRPAGQNPTVWTKHEIRTRRPRRSHYSKLFTSNTSCCLNECLTEDRHQRGIITSQMIVPYENAIYGES